MIRVMRKFYLGNLVNISILSGSFYFGFAQSLEDTLAGYLNELQIATQQNKTLWNYDLYAPTLLVNPQTRALYANAQDDSGLLKKGRRLYSGVLPKEVNIANTSVHWGGKYWAMIMLPLPNSKDSRLNLLSHELFHRAQKSLGFEAFNPENNHLDQRDGRIYLRLELEALKMALISVSEIEVGIHARNALAFRTYRHSIYQTADSTENLLELNEGLCEYTGAMMSGRSPDQMKTHFVNHIEGFLLNPSYVRSFAYETIPVYGYLVYASEKDWNKKITVKTKLTQYFLESFKSKSYVALKKEIDSIARFYNGDSIVKEELTREEKIKKQIADYMVKFIGGPHLEIPLINMKMSFDYRNIMPLADKGTVYPQIRVTDNWGILTAENGALISPDWDKVIVSNPSKIEARSATGDGWTLELNEGYTIKSDNSGKNFIVQKRGN